MGEGGIEEERERERENMVAFLCCIYGIYEFLIIKFCKVRGHKFVNSKQNLKKKRERKGKGVRKEMN